ncbi:MAG: hypothetical protein WC595_00650, partial [Candidatus Nanoarchaeia archaeon]
IEKKIVLAKGEKLAEVDFPDELLEMTLGFIQKLRANENLERVPSVRASLGLYERAQANAYLRNAAYVDMQDVYEAFNSVVSHRIRLKPSVRYLMDTKDFIKKEFKNFQEDMSRQSETDVP